MEKVKKLRKTEQPVEQSKARAWDTVDVGKLSPTKRKMLAALKEDPKITVDELCHRAGVVPNLPWYRALKDPVFRQLVEELGVEIHRGHRQDGWTPVQIKLLGLLEVEENRKLSVKALCTMAGWKSITPWYKAIRDARFRSKVESLGYVIPDRGIRGERLLKLRERLWEVLKVPANRSLPLADLCKLAGTTVDGWYDALTDPAFRDRVVSLRENAKPKLTKVQQRFWDVLQDPANRNLPLVELSAKAGYDSPSRSSWHHAISDPEFRRMLEGIGVPVKRHDYLTRGVVELTDDPDGEWAKDKVDLRKLVDDYPKHVHGGVLKLDFTLVRNKALRAVVKRYFRAQFGLVTTGTLVQRMHVLKPFFAFLADHHPDLASFADLSREMIEKLLSQPHWKSKKTDQQVITAHSRRRMVIALSGMLTYMQRHGWPTAPTRQVVFADDMPKTTARKPRPIPRDVFAQLMSNKSRLRPYDRNLVEIMSVAGLRAEDAMHLKEDCLEYDVAGDPRLRWFNHKMKREGPLLPITHEVAEAIKCQRELVKEVPDHYDGRYLFRTEWGLYKFRSFCVGLNELAKQVPILDANGQVYRFRPHQFRHTVGTEMINNGMGIADVAAYLDHQSLEMTRNYAQIYDETLKTKFKQLVLSGQAAGGVAVEALRDQLAKGDESELDWVFSNWRRQSLPHGYCLHHAKAPACPHANACFTVGNGGPCAKLMTTPEFLPTLKQTLIQIEDNIEIGAERGWDMYVSNQQNQANGIRQVIQELELPADERTRNRGGKP